jgi:hypothetical protein
MQTNLNEMLIDLMSTDPAWVELINILGNFNDTQVLSKVEVLDHLRAIPNSDLGVVEESFRQLGVNLSKDLIASNIAKLTPLFDNVSKWSLVSGTTDWNKYVAFLIDASFNTRRLWTPDYVTFTPYPEGKTILDGGVWYPTPKAELDVSIDLLDPNKFPITITFKDRDLVISTLESLGYSIAQAEFWFDKSVGLEPRNDDPIQRTVRVALLLSRMTDLFYTYAPVEELLEGVWISITAQTNIYVGTSLVLEPTRYVDVGHASELDASKFLTVQSAGLNYANYDQYSKHAFIFNSTSYLASKGYTVAIIDQTSVKSVQSFDTYSDDSLVTANALADYLVIQSPDDILVITSFYDPTKNLVGSNLFNALISIGATAETLTTMKHGSAYVLVGRVGLGGSNGLEKYLGTTSDGTDSAISTNIDLSSLAYSSLPTIDATTSSFTYLTNVRSGQYVYISYKTVYSDGSFKMAQATALDSDALMDKGLGYIEFNEVAVTTPIPITLVYGSRTETVMFSVSPSDYIEDPVDLLIADPSPVFGGQRVLVNVQAAYVGNPDYQALDDNSLLVLTTSLGSIDGQYVVLPDTKYDTPFTITAEYNGLGNKLSDSLVVIAKQSITEIVPIKLEITVPSTLNQGVNTPITTTVTYNDQSSKDVNPAYTISTSKVTIQNSVLASDFTNFDYKATIFAGYMENGVTVTAQTDVSLICKKYSLRQVKVVMDSTIEEGNTLTPSSLGLYALDSASATDVQNGIGVLGWYAITGDWVGSDVSGSAQPLTVDPTTGRFTAPTVSQNTICGLRFTRIEKGVAFAVEDIIEVIDNVPAPIGLEINTRDYIYSGNSSAVNVSALWNNRRLYNADATITVTFNPSESAQAEALIRTQKLINEGDTTASLTNIDYSRWVKLFLQDTGKTYNDPMLNTTINGQAIYFYGDLHGTCDVQATYQGISAHRSIPLAPLRSVVQSIVIEGVEAVGEQSRTFYRALATYSDGTQAYVQPEWSATWEGSDTSDYKLIKFAPATYTGYEIVSLVSGTEPTTFDIFQGLSVSRWAMFDGITSIQQLKDLQLVGAVMTARKVDANTYVAVNARYYRVSAKLDVLVTNKVLAPINTIVAATIIGPASFRADVNYVSYALVNTYQLSGLQHHSDGSYVQGTAKQFDVQVSNDWDIVQTLVDDGTGNYVISTDTVVNLDQDGYIYPVMNVNAQVLIRATFNDGYNAFTRETTVTMVAVNKYLLDLVVYGASTVYDTESKNNGVGYTSGLWYIPYTAHLFTADTVGTTGDLVNATWKLESPLLVSGVRVDETQGYLIVDTQTSDSVVTLVASYTEDTPYDTRETILGKHDVQILASTAITKLDVTLPLSNIDPNTDLQIKATYTRRNGVVFSNLDAAIDPSQDVVYNWTLEETTLPNITLSSSGVIRFPASATAQVVSVTCTLTEGTTTFTQTIDVMCPAVGYPTAITVSGFRNIRDDSVVNYTATVTRRSASSSDVTNLSRWTLQDLSGNTILIRGLNLNPDTGVLTCSRIREDVTFLIHCEYIENAVFENTIQVTVHSSYPKVGVGTFGIKDLAGAETYCTTQFVTDQPAQFTITANEGQYGYLLLRQDYGVPILTAVADSSGIVNNNFGSWNGALKPVGGGAQTGPITLTKTYDNVVDTLSLYRTDNKGFLLTVFTIRYS